MRRKSHVRFGGGRLEKEQKCHLASRLPNELDEKDIEANNEAVANGERILSAYHLKDDTKLYVITEWDRSATTILRPEEYRVFAPHGKLFPPVSYRDKIRVFFCPSTLFHSGARSYSSSG